MGCQAPKERQLPGRNESGTRKNREREWSSYLYGRGKESSIRDYKSGIRKNRERECACYLLAAGADERTQLVELFW